MYLFEKKIKKSSYFTLDSDLVLYQGDCLDLLKDIPSESIQLIVTSPPYNIGKEYEKSKNLDIYIQEQEKVISECVRVLSNTGSICWQVGNYVSKGSIIPLDILIYPIFSELNLQLRNRIVWHYEHGLHCKYRFSGRYEVILWFTKTDKFIFNLDSVRVPQKYPGKKYFKGLKKGQYSCNPLGKNPGDVWIIPNVKYNHVEKTEHPCQYPVELVERLVLSLTNKGDWVLDPYLGSGSSLIGALKHERRGVGSEIVKRYIDIAEDRLNKQLQGILKTRSMDKPIFESK